MSLRGRLAQSAPVRFWRYLAHPPSGSYRERYEAMSEEEKAQARWRGMKMSGFYLAFADMKPRRGKRPGGTERRGRG